MKRYLKRFALRSLKVAGLVALVAVPSQASAQVVYNYTGALPQAIPDNTPAGINFDIIVPDFGPLSALSLTFAWAPDHTFAGDIVMTIMHGATTSDVFRRINAGTGGNGNNLHGPYTFIDSAAGGLATAVATGGVLDPGMYRATDGPGASIDLNTVFGGLGIIGLWRINISDNSGLDVGSVSALSITLTTVPEPTSLALLGIGAGGFALRRLRRKV